MSRGKLAAQRWLIRRTIFRLGKSRKGCRMSSMFSDHPLIDLQEWRGDETLRTVSLEARGLWIEMLVIMHGCEPYGYLMHEGKPMPPKVLAKMVGCHVNKVTKLLRSLGDKRVCSRAGNG